MTYADLESSTVSNTIDDTRGTTPPREYLGAMRRTHMRIEHPVTHIKVNGRRGALGGLAVRDSAYTVVVPDESLQELIHMLTHRGRLTTKVAELTKVGMPQGHEGGRWGQATHDSDRGQVVQPKRIGRTMVENELRQGTRKERRPKLRRQPGVTTQDTEGPKCLLVTTLNLASRPRRILHGELVVHTQHAAQSGNHTSRKMTTLITNQHPRDGQTGEPPQEGLHDVVSSDVRARDDYCLMLLLSNLVSRGAVGDIQTQGVGSTKGMNRRGHRAGGTHITDVRRGTLTRGS